LRAGVAAACAAAAILAGCGTADDEPATTSPPDVPRAFFGVAPQGQLGDADLVRMGQGQVGTLRIFLPWGLIDPTEADDYTWDPYDAVILGAARNGIDVLPFLFGTPNWVAQTLDGEQCGTDCDGFAPRSDAALAAWGDFVAAAVDRYGPDGTLWAENPDVPKRPIRAWQIWNEQNSPTFYQPQPDVAGYAKLLDAATAQIRDRDPGAKVILGGMFGTPQEGKSPAFSAWKFLHELYAIEGTDGFDGVAAHPYAAHLEKVQFQVERMRKEIEAAGDDDASLWITEVGWASSGPQVPLNRGVDGQAQSLTDAFNYFLSVREAWNVDVVIWYSWRDIGESVCDWCPGSGLFPEDSLDDPKPSWDAFTAFTGGS
jgi:polysaccharide biosynthesis protein PslG